MSDREPNEGFHLRINALEQRIIRLEVEKAKLEAKVFSLTAELRARRSENQRTHESAS